MFPDGVKHTPDVDEPSTIELESADGRTASRRQAYDQREVIAPREVHTPKHPCADEITGRSEY
jgi:hypothetical protein